MRYRLAVLMAGVVLAGSATAFAQTAAGAFGGSVVQTTASADVLALTRADAIERWLTHHLGLMAVEQQVESARGSRLRTLRELLPRIDARAGDTRQTSNLAAFGFDSALFPGLPSIVGPYTIFDARARDVVTYVVTNLNFQAAAGESRIEAARSVWAAASMLRATRQDGLPTPQVSGDVGAIGPNPGNARRTYAVAAGVRVPLFDPDCSGRVIESLAALRQRQAEAADLPRRIEAEVRAAGLDLNAAGQLRDVARERVSLANQELSLARIRFAAGVTSNLEVVQAQNEVAVASENEVAAAFSLNVAQAALARAIGE